MKRLAWLSLVCVLLLVGSLYWISTPRHAAVSNEPLVLYCAAGLKTPVEETARQYEQEYGVPVRLEYGGSGTLLSKMRVTDTADLYLAADDTYIQLARRQNLLAETVPLVRIRPVIVVRKGNPKRVQNLQDLLREDIEFCLANPDAASIGRTCRELLKTAGLWDTIEKKTKVFKPTVNDIANDVKIGAVDAGIVWDLVAGLYPELEIVRCPEFADGAQLVSIGVVKKTRKVTAALRFARYLGARDRGLVHFARLACEPVAGDVWEETPRVVLYSGGVNRPAIQETLVRFAKREGVVIDTVYNGCGILVGQMKTGSRPDAYFACDVSFVHQVADLFWDPVNISETAMGILTAKGNPKAIQGLPDLAAPGMRIGVANAGQSALGSLTRDLLTVMGLYDQIMPNVRSQTPTADLLVNQIRTGSLDAVIVYEANTANVRDALDWIPIDHPRARAVQPFAVGKDTRHPQLMIRLLEAVRSAESRAAFEKTGFRWLAGPDGA
ncbi:MAG: substrate-binding domain-containing protein [bacterium]